MGGGLAIDGGIDGENDLAHPALAGARHQRIDAQILRAHAFNGRQGATEQGDADERPGGPAVLGEHHRGHGGDQQQLDDARLGERHVGAGREDDCRRT